MQRDKNGNSFNICSIPAKNGSIDVWPIYVFYSLLYFMLTDA